MKQLKLDFFSRNHFKRDTYFMNFDSFLCFVVSIHYPSSSFLSFLIFSFVYTFIKKIMIFPLFSLLPNQLVDAKWTKLLKLVFDSWKRMFKKAVFWLIIYFMDSLSSKYFSCLMFMSQCRMNKVMFLLGLLRERSNEFELIWDHMVMQNLTNPSEK